MSRRIYALVLNNGRRSRSSSLSLRRLTIQNSLSPSFFSLCCFVDFPSKSSTTIHSSFSVSASPILRDLTTTSSKDLDSDDEHTCHYETEDDGDTTDGWEEEDEAEPQIGDGGDGGGIVLQNVPWGERVLTIAREVLLQFDDDLKLYAFKATPRGYIYVRLDKLCNKYGCPSMEEIESYSREYKKKLEEIGASGDIPSDLALEVSSPSAERVLKVPDDLDRFRDMPMRVSYVEDLGVNAPQKDGVFLLESIDTELENCVWKLADVKENRDALGKGRPLSRKQKDWRLNLPFAMFKKVTLHIEF